ncbi:hypothetical protein B0O99DRAFT_601264 [Bisporella sp. PMI_857]|nr:hypothetical protein B0O99DRAFT_601264 [Bisporella sp. PMI_857]
MYFSILSIYPFLAHASAVAFPAFEAEATVSEGAAPIPKAWEVAPAAFQKIPELVALHTNPDLPQGKPEKTEAEANLDALMFLGCLRGRQAHFNWILTYVLPYTSASNTYYYLPYIYNTCFSFAGSNLDNVLSAVRILNPAVYCYFYDDYTCGAVNGFTFASYANTPLNANAFMDNTWSSYICYGACSRLAKFAAANCVHACDGFCC